MNEEIKGLAKHMRVSEEELHFLEVYEDSLNIMESARTAGLNTVNIHRRLRANTPFAKLYRKLVDNIDKDTRFNKVGSISMLMELKEKAEDKGDYNLAFKIIQEINKMIEGNIASTKRTVENIDVKLEGVIDLTEPPKEIGTVDIPYEEA